MNTVNEIVKAGTRNILDPSEVGDEAALAIRAVAPSALAVQAREEIDSQIATAKKYPRSVDRARKEALSLATMDREIAASCIYAKPRAGKTLEGPSVRLAEILMYAWGNLRLSTRIVRIDHSNVTAQGTVIDLEKNTGYQVEEPRLILDKNGRRYNDDMISTTGKAAMSIAGRNAILKVIPSALVKEVYERAKAVARGEGKTLDQIRNEWLDGFKRGGYKPEDVYRVLGIRGFDDMQLEHVDKLIGMSQAVKANETTWDEVFAPEIEAEPEGKPTLPKAERLAARMEKPVVEIEPREPGSDDQ